MKSMVMVVLTLCELEPFRDLEKKDESVVRFASICLAAEFRKMFMFAICLEQVSLDLVGITQ